MVTWTEALDIEIARSGHDRYRWLCSDENPDAKQRDDYRSLMIRKATGEADPQVSPQIRPSSPDPWLPLIRACDDYNPGCCAQPLPFCTMFNINPTREQCIECLTGRGISPE